MPDNETLEWYGPEERTPPERACLFVRLERVTDGIINFATSIYDPERGFLYLRLEDVPLSGHGVLPPNYTVTHWALSARANKTGTAYAWLEKEPEPPPPVVARTEFPEPPPLPTM